MSGLNGHIQRVSEEAILRRLCSEYTFQLSSLLVQVQTLKKRAEKCDRRALNNVKSKSLSTTDESGEDEDDVFDKDIPPPPPIHNIETRLTHADLIERSFMVKLLDMPIDCQKLVREAPFNHYYPWFIVSKNDSISTLRRIVVDPSCTGLNQILPKGENRIGTIPDIIIRNRTKPVGWASDISKMYNQLRLDKSAYPFTLFLYHDSLNEDVEPDTYVMVRA